MGKIKWKTIARNAGTKVRISGKTLNKMHHHESADGVGTDADIISSYDSYKHAKTILILVILVLAVILFGVDVGLGKYSLSFIDVYNIIFERIFGIDYAGTQLDRTVVWEYRLPRVLTAVIAGFGLAVAGAAMQSMLKNPLADPYTTGISSGAAFGATLSITLGITLIDGDYGTVINAFVCAMIPALFIVGMSTYRKPSPAMIILAGTSLMYIFNALQSYFMLIADPDAAAGVYAWTVGNLSSASWSTVPLMFVITVIGSIVLMYMAKILNTMNSGDSYARSIGINVNAARIIILITISVLAAGIVSFTGIIGFVGLVGPHIARMFVGSDNKILIPAAGLMGSCVLLLADAVVQFVSTSIPVGIITSIIGGPLFLFLILRQKKEVW